MDNAFTQLPKKAFQSSGALVALFYMVGFGVGTTWVNKDHAEAKHYYEAWAKKIELSIETHGKCPENYEIMMEGVEKPRLVNNHMQITCEDKAYSMSYVDITGCIFPPTYVYTSETKEWTVYD